MKKIDWHKFANNLALKIIALVFAAVLWLIVGLFDDPVETKAFNNISIEIKNEEIITNDGKKFKIMDDIDSVRVVVRAKKSTMNKIDSRDITAVVDLRQRDTSTGVTPITAVVSGHEEDTEVTTETSPNNVLIRVEDVASKSFPISVLTENEPREGYELGEMKANPERVEISGAKSSVEDIQRVVAKIDINGISSDSELDAKELIVFDGNNNVMDQSSLQLDLSAEDVSVSVKILPSKEVPLKFSTSGTPAEGYYLTGLSCVPETVNVYGTKSVLEALAEIDIPAAVIDISGANSKTEYTVDITPYLPENVNLSDENAGNVVVTVMVEREGTRTILLPVGAVRINNLDESLSAEVETTGELEVLFEGKEELLEKLDIKNAASIDLKDYKEPGTYEVPVNIEIDSNIILVEKPVITVALTEKTEESGQTEKNTE